MGGARGIREKCKWNFLTTTTPCRRDKRLSLLRATTERPVDSDMHGSAVLVVTTCFVKWRIERHKSLSDREGMVEEGGTIARWCFAEIAANGILEDFPAVRVGCGAGGGEGEGGKEGDDERMQRLLRSGEIRKRRCGDRQISMGENYSSLSQLTHNDNSDCCSSVLCLR